nr:nucleoside recognition domain-containing protein [Chitinophagales bacterium]
IPIYILLITMFVPSTRVLGFLTLQGLNMMGLYVLGFVAALGSALVFKMFLPQKSNAPLFLTEMPIYRRPRWRNVVLGIYNKCKTFVVEAGKIILLISLILWLLASYGPGQTMEEIDQKYEQQKALLESQTPRPEEEIHVLAQQHASERLKNSYAGRIGHFIEPAIAPLGYDWKIGICLLTSFAAREVFVGTMATIYGIESDIATEHPETLIEKMKRDTYPKSGKPVYTPAVGFSLLIFYAFAMQCMSTLAITRRETNSWKWTLIMLFYMTAMAYFAAWLVFRVMS